jgi:Arc/MetJ-type ribon-helix-helix transcriptional regulator
MILKSKHINVRFEEEIYADIVKRAEQERRSKSDVVRTALSGELAKISEQTNKVLTNEQRVAVLNIMGKVMTHVSVIRNDNAKLGRNVNQIAKSMNKGMPGVSEIELKAYKDLEKRVDAELSQFSKGLDAIWRILV